MRDVFFPLYEVWGSPKRGGGTPGSAPGIGASGLVQLTVCRWAGADGLVQMYWRGYRQGSGDGNCCGC